MSLFGMQELGQELLAQVSFEGCPQAEIEKKSSEDKALSRLFSELQSVCGRDLLAQWHVQYGIIDAADWAQEILHKFGISGMRAYLKVMLSYLQGSSVGDVHIVVQDNRFQSSCRCFLTGRELSGMELYMIGFRRCIKYLCMLADSVEKSDSRAGNETLSRYIGLQEVGLGYFGYCADAQVHFVKNVLPKLQDKFADRPTSYSKDVPSSLAWEVASGLFDLIGLAVYSSSATEERVREELESVDEAYIRYRIGMSEVLSYGLLEGMGYEDLKCTLDSPLADIFENARTAYLRKNE